MRRLKTIGYDVKFACAEGPYLSDPDGFAAFDGLQQDSLIAGAAAIGGTLLKDLRAVVLEHDLQKEVRGKGLTTGLEFGQP